MKKENKILLKAFFIAGLSFAIAMAFYGYLTEERHLFLKFIVHFILFGSTMGILARRKYLKEKHSALDNKQKKDK